MFEFLLNSAQLTEFLASAIRLATPLIFAAIGGLICERAGVFNIALEGQILLGAFAAALGTYYTGSPWGGLATAVLFGGLSGLVLAVVTVRMQVNQIVMGIAMVLFSTGFTSFMSRIAFPGGGNSLSLPGFKPISIPVLSDIPVLGRILFGQDVMFYIMLVLVLGVHFVLFRTQLGLNIRAAGEHPGAADTAGVPIFALRYGAVISGSVFAALGGAYIVLTQIFLFADQMSAGKGFIALAAIVLGRWNPILALLACLLFGFFDALQLRMQFFQPQVPNQIFAALPYLVALLALVGLIGRVRPPAAVGKIYDREMR
jgi:ABC-type uncharacterized transport system permease subunit